MNFLSRETKETKMCQLFQVVKFGLEIKSDDFGRQWLMDVVCDEMICLFFLLGKKVIPYVYY